MGKGEIKTGSRISKIYHNKKEILSLEIEQNNQSVKLNGNEFISSIPVSDFIRYLEPKAPDHILRINNRLKYRDEVQVVLNIRKNHITPDTWIYVHSLDLPFVRFMEMDNWSNQLSPKNTTSIVFEIACTKGDKLWNNSDKEDQDGRQFNEDYGEGEDYAYQEEFDSRIKPMNYGFSPLELEALKRLHSDVPLLFFRTLAKISEAS